MVVKLLDINILLSQLVEKLYPKLSLELNLHSLVIALTRDMYQVIDDDDLHFATEDPNLKNCSDVILDDYEEIAHTAMSDELTWIV